MHTWAWRLIASVPLLRISTVTMKIVLTFKDDAKDELFARSKRMVRTGPPFKLVGAGRSVQFLRGVLSRASLCLPAFYYFLGSASAHDAAKTSGDYPFKVAQSYSEFSDLPPKNGTEVIKR